MPSKFQFITELYEKTLLELTDKAENWIGFLRAACYNYKCPFDEQVLIYAQRPNATAVLELDKWNKQFGRWINHGAHGIAVFSDDKGGRLKYYFDVSDTHSSRYSRPLPIWKMEQRYENEVIEALENTFGELKEKYTLVGAVFSACRNAASDNIPDYLHDLEDCVEDSLLEELDDLNLEVRYKRLIETSVAYMLLTRLSVNADEYITREDFEYLHDFNTLPTINALGIAASDIAEMGLREISRTIMSLRKEHFFENSGKAPYDKAKGITKIYDERSSVYGNDLQNRGRLQDAQSFDAAAVGSASGQVRGAAEAISYEAPESTLYEPQDDREADKASGGNRESCNSDGQEDYDENGTERRLDGETEAERPDEMDGAYEQFPALGGGNSPERPDLQLKTNEAGGESELPAFLNERFIQAVVLDDGGRTVTRQGIFSYFQSHKNSAERCEFLKNAYNETCIELLVDETRVGYEKQENGLLMWECTYLSRVSESVFSWGVVAEITENLITHGEYVIRLGLQDMPEVAEQLALFEMGASNPVYEIGDGEPVMSLFLEREIPQEVIDSVLFTAGNQSDSALRIVVQYMYERPEEENIAFLRREFGKDNGRGIELDGIRFAIWFTEDGIRFAEGNCVRTGLSRKTVSWADCSARILGLLSEGKYVSQSELGRAYETVLRSCADGLIFIARDLSDEGKEQNLFQIVRSIYEQHMGFPDCSENLAAYMRNENGLIEIASEYREFQKAYYQNREVSRFRVSSYNTHRIELILGETEYRRREFTARPNFIRQCKMFITQDEIEQYFMSDSKDGRLAIYSYFCNNQVLKEKQDFLKSIYGSYSGGCCDGYSHTKSGKGLIYERSYGRKNYETVQLTFPQIAKIYDKLIADKRFPGEDALVYIPEYQTHQIARSVYSAFYGVPNDIPRPFPKNADFYEGVPAVEKLLTYPEKVQELLTVVSSITDGTQPGERYYDTRINAQKALSEFATGTYDLFGGRQRELTVPEIRTPAEEPLTRDHEEQLPQFIVDSISRSVTEQHTEPVEDKTLAPTTQKGKTQAISFTPIDKNGLNFCISDDQLGIGTVKEKFRRNIEAIVILNHIEKSGSHATPEQQEILLRYVGWGGLSEAFDENKPAWASENQTLRAALTDEEYALARESSLTAFYTPPMVIRSIYKVLENMGFTQGNILEPSCGTGNFFGMLPDSMVGSKLYGVELDSISGRIAKQLYQKAGITVQGFEKADIPDSFFDIVIGNVPFGQFKVADRRYDKLNFLIHDYFFAKALDKVRPGGMIAFVTSKGTLDKENPSVRRYIAQRADLLGAVRLPNTTFRANAGTEVTSDIIFLQKRDRLIDIEPDWVHLGKDENGIPMNQYFIDNPGMLMGEMKMISGPFGPESACVLYEEQSLEDMLSDAVQYIHGEIADYERDDEIGPDDKPIPADPTVRNFSYTLVDDRIYYRENSRMYPVELAITADNRIRGMITLRDCVRQLIAYQTEDYPDDVITAQQRRLNSLYDSFTASYGLINSRGNSMAFSEDSSYFLLCSLEIVDEDGNLERKADLFTKRTIRSHKPAEKVDTASEALAVSIGEKARVDMEYMEKLTGKSEEELYADLKGVIFLNPMHGYISNAEEKYLPADEYLSGNVRQKLDLAKRFAEINPDAFTVNAEALTQVQPVDLAASEISVRLGATWLPPEVPQQFMYELLGTPRWAQYRLKVHYSKLTGEWRVEGKTQDQSNVKAYSTYGTKRINAYTIIEESLNLKDVRIFDYLEEADGKKTAVLNKKETAIAQAKQELIRSEFAEWVWRDPERRERLCSLYNTIFNSNRPREYDGSHITFNGMNPEITLRVHQINAIAHILYGGNTLLAHTVGAGKTFEMVAAAMESKRLGLCQKSLFVVPNHLTEQWASEFLQLYPSANILVATKKDFETKNRKKFCGRISTGEYDAVIIGHSQFEKIPMSIERQRAILEQQIDEILMGISEAKNERAENFTIKQMEKTRKGLQLKLDKLNDQSRKDDVVNFEELGVDRLFVDESHGFKNLFLYTKMRNVGGIAQTETQKSSDLFMKCRYLDEITVGRGIIFATGTPISNSMVELYTIQRYLQMSALTEQELQHFDAWASNYGETITAIELSPEGTGYRAKTRFAKFYNLPELMSMFKNVADIQTADILNLPVPAAIYHNVALKPSEYQKEMVAALAERAERVRNREVDSSEDNMLLITNDGRKLALDQRLMNPMLPDDPNSKASTCAQKVFEIWQRTAAKQSAQMIFCDLSTPHYDGSFNVYDDIKNKLISMGIPESEIAFIHDANTEIQKKEMFAKVRSGQIRVLMGSTQRMGAGTNAQNKLIALHHVDCPWRPSDLQQREGRIIRQGNENPTVEIFSYVTEQTFDAYLYQLVESKQKFISQIMTSKSPVRSAEDVDETALSYAEIKALATGNPMIKEKMDLDIEVSRLKLLKSSHLSQKYSLEDQIIKQFPKQIAEIAERITGYAADLVTVTENTHPNEDGFSPMVLMGTTYIDKKAAGSELLSICHNMLTPDAAAIGAYRGLTLELSYDSFSKEYRLSMISKLRHTVSLGTDIYGNIQRMDNQLETLPVKEQNCRERMEELHKQLETAKVEVEKPFAKEDELKAKTVRLDALNALLNMDGKEHDNAEKGEKTMDKGYER